MRAEVRMSLTVILVAAGVLAPVSTALAADGIVGGSFSVVTSAYRSTPGSQIGHSGYNFLQRALQLGSAGRRDHASGAM